MGKKVAIIAGALLVLGAGITFFGYNKAQARVCFVDDPDCNGVSAVYGTGNSSACTTLGYSCSAGGATATLADCSPETYASNARAWVSDTITRFSLTPNSPDHTNYWTLHSCHYDNKLHVPCPKAWRKTACPSSMHTSTRSCLDYHDCTCPAEYRYTYELETNLNPLNIKNNVSETVALDSMNVLHCAVSGPYCTRINLDGAEDSAGLYATCDCRYPYVAASTDQPAGQTSPYKENADDYCVNNKGKTYYRGWACDTTYYNKTAYNNDCEFGLNVFNKCFNYEDQTYYYNGCLNCDNFPAKNLDYVKTELTISGEGSHILDCVATPTAVDDPDSCVNKYFNSSTIAGTTVYQVDTTAYSAWEILSSPVYGWVPKYSYLKCPLSTNNNPRYYIAHCTEPGMRPSTPDDIKRDENGEPILDEEQQEQHYQYGEACVPISCEDAVTEVLKLGKKVVNVSSNTFKFTNGYGVLKSPKPSSLYGVTFKNNAAVEDYYFFDADDQPIVEQYINSPEGGYLRTRISNNYYRSINKFESEGSDPDKYYGYGYSDPGGIGIPENGTWEKARYNNKSIYTAADMNEYVNSNGSYNLRRKAIVVSDLTFSEMGGVSSQPKLLCRRRGCYVNVNGEKHFWKTAGIAPSIESSGNTMNNMCPFKCRWGVCDAARSISSNCIIEIGGDPNACKWTKHYNICKEDILSADQLKPYWSRATGSGVILGNNGGNTHNKCGDVNTAGTTCVTCFAKGFVVPESRIPDGVLNPAWYPTYQAETPCYAININDFDSSIYNSADTVPTAVNNCLAKASDGPAGNHWQLTFSGSGTLWGGTDIHLQGDDDTECLDNGWDEEDPSTNSGHDRFNIPVGLGGAPVDEYISVKAFYDDINAASGLNTQFKQVATKMLERSCYINKPTYQKPKITYSGTYFPADDSKFFGTEGNTASGPTNFFQKQPRMVFRGVDIDLTSNDVTVARQFLLEDVVLKASGYLTINTRPYSAKGPAYGDTSPLLVGHESIVSNSVIYADNFSNRNGNLHELYGDNIIWGTLKPGYITQTQYLLGNLVIDDRSLTVLNSTILVDEIWNSGADAEIKNTNICGYQVTFSRNGGTMHLTSDEGNNYVTYCGHEVFDPYTLDAEGNRLFPHSAGATYVAWISMNWLHDFRSVGYKYVGHALDLGIGNAFVMGSLDAPNADKAYFEGSNSSDIVVDDLYLNGVSMFKNMDITASVKVEIGDENSCDGGDDDSIEGTFVNMDSSVLSMPAGSTFIIHTPSVIGKPVKASNDTSHFSRTDIDTTGIVLRIYNGEYNYVRAVLPVKGQSNGFIAVDNEQTQQCVMTSLALSSSLLAEYITQTTDYYAYRQCYNGNDERAAYAYNTDWSGKWKYSAGAHSPIFIVVKPNGAPVQVYGGGISFDGTF